jgi:hypothetical protein
MIPSKTVQAPIRSGYGPETTAREVLRGRLLDGVTAVVTGGYAGVGLETTRALVWTGIMGRWRPGGSVAERT